MDKSSMFGEYLLSEMTLTELNKLTDKFAEWFNKNFKEDLDRFGSDLARVSKFVDEYIRSDPFVCELAEEIRRKKIEAETKAVCRVFEDKPKHVGTWGNEW